MAAAVARKWKKEQAQATSQSLPEHDKADPAEVARSRRETAGAIAPAAAPVSPRQHPVPAPLVLRGPQLRVQSVA